MYRKSIQGRVMRIGAFSLLMTSATMVAPTAPAAAQTAVVPPQTQAVRAQPKAVRTLTEQEMIDMMIGSSIQATRATNTESMIRQIRAAFAQGRKFTMIDTDAVGDDWVVAMPGAVGGGGPWEFVLDDVKKANLPEIADPAVKAMEMLGQYSGRKIDAIIRVESAEATLRAFLVASALGVPVVDSCLSGRARPEGQQSIPDAQNISRVGTSVGVTRWGDVLVFANVAAPIRREHLMRAAAVASGGVITMASARYTGSEIRTATLKGSLTQAIQWGRTVREASAKGQDPIGALTKVSNGYRLFQGIVSKAEVKGDKGFTYWDVEMTGNGQYTGHSYKIFVKNENIVTWLDGKPDAMSPDFISNLDPKTGAAISSGTDLGAYHVGREVVIVGIPASPMWRIPRGIDLMGPRHYGFDFDYVPIEQQMKLRTKFPK